LTQGKEWRHAVRLAYKHGRGDLVTTVVAPAAAEAAGALLDAGKEGMEKLDKYFDRLCQVRTRRMALAEAVGRGGGAVELNNLRDDAVSDAGTLASMFSAYTAASMSAFSQASQTRSMVSISTLGGRKAAGKRRGGGKKNSGIRAGAANEEAKLLDHISSLGPMELTLTETGALAEMLVMLGHRQDAVVLQRVVGQWLDKYAKVQEEVCSWGPKIPEWREPELVTPYMLKRDMEQATLAWAKRKLAIEALKAKQWKWDILREVKANQGDQPPQEHEPQPRKTGRIRVRI